MKNVFEFFKSMDKKKIFSLKSKENDKKFTEVSLLNTPVRDDMTESEFEEVFAKFMDEMNIGLDKRGPLLTRSIEDKRKLLSQIHSSSETSPSNYINTLVDIVERQWAIEKIIVKLDSLRVYLNSSPLSRVKEFNNESNNGLNKLVIVLSHYIDNAEISLHCLKCLRAFGNCGYGLLTLINNKEALLYVSLCLNAQYPNLMCLAIELLTLFTFYSFESHANVMEALYLGAQMQNHIQRFIPIINGLDVGIHNRQSNLLIPCLQFINVIVNPNFNDTSTCSNLDLYYRMHLRIEFVSCGLNTYLDSLSNIDDENIKQYILAFQTDTDDEDEYNNKIELEVLLQNRDAVYQLLNRTLCQTNCDSSLTSILKHLVIIKDTPIRYNLFRLINDVISELILHSDGMCLDPTLNQLDGYNLTDVFEKFNDPNYLQNTTELQEKYNKILEEKHETEVKLFSLENKMGIKASEILQTQKQPQTVNQTSMPPPPAPPAPPPPLPINNALNAPPMPPPPPPGVPPPLKEPMLEPIFPFGMQIKSNLKPKGLMKKANWNKVDIKLLDRNCVWKKINDSEMNTNEMLMELNEKFSTRAFRPKDVSDDNSSLNSYSTLPKKVKEFKVLDSKSGQNLAILSGSFKVPAEEIKRRILELDEGLLTQTNVENLLKSLPPQEQLAKLSRMQDDYENLNEAEQFGCTLSTIKHLHARLNSFLFKMKFSERISDIKPAIVCATQALNEIRHSSNFIKILELILICGNFMNASSKHNQTVAFHINFLGKLIDTKDNQNEGTLMEFIVNQVRNKYPYLINFTNEFSYLDKAAKVSNETINSTIVEMKKMKTDLERELKDYKQQSDNDNYFLVMQEFLVNVNEQLTLISEMNKILQSSFREMAKYLSFDIQKYPMEEFFHDIKIFKDNFQKANKEIEIAIQNEHRRQKAREEQLRREMEKTERHTRQCKATQEDDKKVLDNLLVTLNSGNAFGNRKDPRKKRLKKTENIVVINRSRSRRDFDKNLIQVTPK